MNARSVGCSPGSLSRAPSIRAPTPIPTSCSLRYDDGPVGQPRVDRPVEREDALGHAAGRGDDDDHQHLRLQRQDLDVADRGRGDRRRRDDRQQVGDLRQRLGRHAHRLVDLAPHQRRAAARPCSRAWRAAAVDEVAVAGVGRHAAGGRVRMREQALLLEHRELVADGRRPAGHVGVGGERLRPHGLARGVEAFDDLAEQQLLAGREHASDSKNDALVGPQRGAAAVQVRAQHDLAGDRQRPRLAGEVERDRGAVAAGVGEHAVGGVERPVRRLGECPAGARAAAGAGRASSAARRSALTAEIAVRQPRLAGREAAVAAPTASACARDRAPCPGRRSARLGTSSIPSSSP